MNKVVSEKEFEINYYEVDFKKQLLITSLMNYFDDVATKQSEDIGGGLDYMRNKGIAWVLYKWDITIKRYPMFREKIKVRTSSYSLKKFYGYRTFEVFDKNNDVICSANSVWLLIDINKRRAKRITEDIYKMYGLTEKDNKPLIIENVRLPEKFDFERHFDVRYSDIDTNNHVNNVKYVDWAIETVPIDIVLNYSLENLNITYKKEAVYGENVKSSTKVQKTDCGYIGLHKISDNSDKELCVIKTVWKNKKKC
ncbi:acyl-[acyl-carrier-protein] thioesterase [Clostridium tyrobutyricum]|uniref:acyl-[acyl-carrier-protein] thioesterase n=1 Tax=Clostridium tyrobutyricum TaxID=1519 RepID=UPI001C386E3D|nr:acyl-ACP thioesterase domain-containing protein [Clostridium tyrobutyricum]MBV4422717.1 acyl-ACP thioesterase [Clostridium tyrobutyricum]